MTQFDIDTVRDLLGEPVPGGAVPAVWWISTDQAQLDAFDQWKADYAAHYEKVGKLAETIGLAAEDGLAFSWHKRTELTGFRAPLRMGGVGADAIPIPDGWRIDRKQDRLVPSRKTKADRESQANKDFAAVKAVPNVRAYMTGLPTEIFLDDRDFGGTSYAVQYRRGAKCVWAYCGGDPDRQPEKRMNDAVDDTIWHRQKLSVLVALREEADE